MRFIVGSNAFSFNLTGADGNSAGGQLAGSQHYAEDGPTCLICSLATLQRQVYSHPHPQVIHYMHNVLGTVYIHVSFLPVCSGSNTRQKGSCARWPGSRCPNLTGETGGSRGRVWHKWGCLNHKSNVLLNYFFILLFLTPVKLLDVSVFLLSVTEKQTHPLFIFYAFFVWLLGDRMGRISLSLCPKISTFTWRKLQSTLLMLLVKQTFFYLHHNDAVEVQTQLEHSCWLTTNPPMYLLYLHFFTVPASKQCMVCFFIQVEHRTIFSASIFSFFYCQCCAFSWSTSGW